MTSSLKQPLLVPGLADMSASAQQSQLYKVGLAAEPGELLAGREASLAFTVTDQEGTPVPRLTNTHEKPIHLIVVSSDLNNFAHLHPEQTGPGVFRTSHRFPAPGMYLLFADFAGPSGKVQVERFAVHVTGGLPAGRTSLQSMTGILSVDVDGTTVRMDPGTPFPGKDGMLSFNVLDSRSNLPATDLQPYLGEAGHFVIISEDGAEFVHAHPADHSTGHHHAVDGHGHHGMHGATRTITPEVQTAVTFPKAGLYKIWAQFQRHGTIIVAPFVVEVKGE